MKHAIGPAGIPLATSLDEITQNGASADLQASKKRLVYTALLAVVIGVLVSFLAKLLVYLIDLVTNLAFFHRISIAPASPADNAYGIFVIAVPVIGGVLVGLMALYGSQAIRGHGIPEAMEQILTNKSKIRPSITYLKPLSADVS